MTTSTGKTGQGVAFQISDGASTPTWTSFTNVRSINPTGKQADEIDFTHLLSTGGYRELRQGFKDGGTINVEYHFDPTDDTHIATTGFIGLFNNGTVFTWRINFTGAGWAYALTGSGFCSNPGDIDINVDGPITASATIRVTGAVSIVAVS